MAIPLIPLLFGGLSALGGARGNRQQQTQEQNTSSTTNTSGTQNSVFDNTSTQGFAPGFEGNASDLISRMFGSFGTDQLDPEELNRMEIAQKLKANNLATQLFSSLGGNAASRGLQYSGAGQGLARGLSESFRGSNILDIANNFAQQRFNLPVANENLNASRRSGLLGLFNALPRTVTNTGTNTTTSNQTSNTQGTASGTSQSGNGGGLFSNIINAVGGGLAGFGAAGGFNNTRLAGLFGNQAQPERYQPNGIIPSAPTPSLQQSISSGASIGAPPSIPYTPPQLTNAFPNFGGAFATPPFNPNVPR